LGEFASQPASNGYPRDHHDSAWAFVRQSGAENATAGRAAQETK